jgi:hypothetical protein
MKNILTAAIASSLFLAGFGAAAQEGARARPPGTMPLEAPPPLPPIRDGDTTALEQQQTVTTRIEGDQTIQEYRVNGKVTMMKVTPKGGLPYVLMDRRGDGTFTKQDSPLDQGVRVPQWTLLEF